MIWLDRPVESCIASLTERDLRGGGDRVAFSALPERASDYEKRGGSSARAAHGDLARSFGEAAVILRNRKAIKGLLRIT
ncbi:MAG: hypothetical protein INR68_05645 [Methylobacterium mesophilicum]|nr:hypothetical protein [Methylobacterium mesophilicum]